MANYTIYHNASCSTSREALALLEENGIKPKVVLYLKDVLSERQLEMLLMKLGIKAEELLRRKEPLFKKKFGKYNFHEHEWVKVMHQHPELIERPIVVKGHKAVIGRPTENIQELIDRP